MFTIKFISHCYDVADADEDGCKPVRQHTHTQAIHCPHYGVHERPDGGVTITVYKDFFTTEGVECQIRADTFEHCYVENLAGKTVAHYSAAAQGDLANPSATGAKAA